MPEANFSINNNVNIQYKNAIIIILFDQYFEKVGDNHVKMTITPNIESNNKENHEILFKRFFVCVRNKSNGKKKKINKPI